jgi:TolA-binding protein
MNSDRVIELLEEIRDLQGRLVESHRQALHNQQEAVRAQREAIARGRKLQVGLGIVIVALLAVVLVLFRYVIQRFA